MVNVSIVIPVYNVEKYIIRCLDSVRNQTYSDYEVLLIDDKGSDKSVDIVREYIDTNHLTNWKIVSHNKNRGLSAARNTGIQSSGGNYIYFLDSDDTITENCLELLVSHMHDDVDFVMSVYDNIPAGISFPLFGNGSFTQSELIQKYCRKELPWNAVNRLVRKSFLQNQSLYFAEGLLSEDLLWNYLLLAHVRKVVLVNQVTYHYYVNQGSIMNTCSYNYKYISDLLKISNEMLAIEQQHPSVELLRYYHEVRYDLIPNALLWYGYPLKFKIKTLKEIFKSRFKRDFKCLPIVSKMKMCLPSLLLIGASFTKFYWSEYYPVLKRKLRIV